MIIRTTLSSIAAVTLLAAPVAAQAAPRVPAPVEGEQMEGNSWLPFAIGLAVLVILLLVVVDDGDEPESP